VTSYVLIIVTYLVPCTVSEIWQIIGPIFTSTGGVPVFNALVGGPKFRIVKLGLKKLETSLKRTVHTVFQYLEPFRCDS